MTAPTRGPRTHLFVPIVLVVTALVVAGLGYLIWHVASFGLAVDLSWLLAKVVLTGKALKAVGAVLLVGTGVVVAVRARLRRRPDDPEPPDRTDA